MIYRHLLDDNCLAAAECIFMDDIAGNVDGARAAGMNAFVFEGAAQVEAMLRAAGLEFL